MSCWCAGECPNVKDARSAPNDWAAEEALKRALVRAPDCARANLMLAQIYTRTNRAYAAQEHIDRARLQREVPVHEIWLSAGNMFRQNGDLESALVAYRHAMADTAGSKFAAPFQQTILTLERRGQPGDIAEAFDLSDEMMKRFGDSIGVRRARAALYAAEGSYDTAIHWLREPLHAALPYVALFERGRYYDKAGKYVQAWADWEAAKAKVRDQGGVFAHEDFDRVIGDYQFVSTPQAYGHVRHWHQQHPWSPLFIFGFPRSGTTMLEQALSAHSQIVAGDELQFVNMAARLAEQMTGERMPLALMYSMYGDCAPMMRILAKYYLAQAARKEPRVEHHEFFTDKMPLNEICLPFIRAMFPHAPMIRLMRDPRDIFVSTMSYYLSHGWFYGSSLESMAYAYVRVDSLMRHYEKSGIAPPAPVYYEHFVDDAEFVMRKYLPTVNLEFERACVDFHENPRHTRTISYSQVREPAHTRSVKRWEHYADKLAPILPIIEPILKREGYT